MKKIGDRKIGNCADLDAALGKLPDARVAFRFRCSVAGVRRRRRELGIEPFNRWRSSPLRSYRVHGIG